jgi:TPR repeat protein
MPRRLRLALAALAVSVLAACGAASSQPAGVSAGATTRVACEGGDAACSGVPRASSTLPSRAPAAAEDPAREVAQFSEACEGGAADACTKAGEAFAEGRGVKRDDARAAALFRRGCEQGARPSCLELGVFRAAGRGGPRDEGESTALLRKACEEGDERSLGCRLFSAPPADRAQMRDESRRKIPECNLLIDIVSATMDGLGQAMRNKDRASDLRGVADMVERGADQAAGLRLTVPTLMHRNTEYQDMARRFAKATRALAKASDDNDRAAIKAALAELEAVARSADFLIDALNTYCQAP